MTPHETDRYGRPWRDLGYCAALAPVRKPPTKRSRRERMRDRTRSLQRRMKRAAHPS